MKANGTGWTDTVALRALSLKSWERGDLLRELLEPSGAYPRRRTLKSPGAGELREHFAQVRDWAQQLQDGAEYYSVETRSMGHQSIGANEVPQAVVFESPGDEISFAGKARQAAAVQAAEPGLRPWIISKPMDLLNLGADAVTAASVARWLLQNPDPGIYLRQLALAGVHTKFVEHHLKPIDQMAAVLAGREAPRGFSLRSFRERHGFASEPETVRLRARAEILAAPGGATDLQIPAAAFEALELDVATVLVTENKTNFLALPLPPQTLVLFGGGYGLNGLRSADWVNGCDIVYWGDIDTHGFAILDRLRAHHPRVRSVLMDKQTFIAHRAFWGVEDKQSRAALARLDAVEAELHAQLLDGTHGQRLRLEQEQIQWDFALEQIAAACAGNTS